MTRRTVSFPSGLPTVRNALESVVQKLGFWGAVFLPLAYLPVLYVEFGQGLSLLLGLVILNVACLLVGHEYAREQ